MINSATEIAKKSDLSHFYLYYHKNEANIGFETIDNGEISWDGEVLKPPYKTTKINNRRYLGNEYKLLDFIKKVVESECDDISTVADIFAGTGAVASAFTDKKIITNDIMYSNYICHVAWFSPEKYDEDKIQTMILEYNAMQPTEENLKLNIPKYTECLIKHTNRKVHQKIGTKIIL